ncbi:MAG: DUF6122 family protein [Saprospiraceae bacterium]|nr:DUF6122 family protein [Saprospiraceae bacterium]
MEVLIHYFLHLGFPLFIALVFFRKEWKKAYLLLLATMAVDLDHLLAQPIFEPNRCSINFHPLHTYYAILVYAILLFFPKNIRIIAIGLLFHMLTDFIDCLFMYAQCADCFAHAPAADLLKIVASWLGIPEH